MTEDGRDQMDPPSPKVVAALLREARSVSRRADKLGADVAAVQDPTIQELAAQASSSIDQLVHQLMRLDQQAQRTRRAPSSSFVAGAGAVWETSDRARRPAPGPDPNFRTITAG